MDNLMVLQFILKVIRMIIIIFNTSFFVGLGWLCITKIEHKLLTKFMNPNEHHHSDEDLFITYFNIENLENM